MSKKRSVQLKLDRFLSRGDDEGRFKRARFTDGVLVETRSIIQAYTEYEQVSSNVYNHRPRASFSEDKLPLCACKNPDTGELACGSGCENRARSLCYQH
ncbi:hypothetical protein PR002_g32769 [Phytophthora rubi]|uniref:AWS domain-containing protein n=1 Tax=Phytophthora rubi TaxID=129364 RepID=A0A6A3G3D3_9STRA|nr:hypothetical protein PR002_g32769 [Phytophthora rubi]